MLTAFSGTNNDGNGYWVAFVADFRGRPVSDILEVRTFKGDRKSQLRELIIMSLRSKGCEGVWLLDHLPKIDQIVEDIALVNQRYFGRFG